MITTKVKIFEQPVQIDIEKWFNDHGHINVVSIHSTPIFHDHDKILIMKSTLVIIIYTENENNPLDSRIGDRLV